MGLGVNSVPQPRISSHAQTNGHPVLRDLPWLASGCLQTYQVRLIRCYAQDYSSTQE